jgi:hypothetical protein
MRIVCITLLFFFSITHLSAQTSLLDSTKLDRIGSKKNGFYFEALGSSYIAGLYYQRTVPLAKNNVHLRFQGGFSPFSFGSVSFSSGVSLTTGAGVYFFRTRFKMGVTMMLIHGLYFEPIKDQQTGYRLFLQPQLNFEYHFSQRFVGRASFTPTFIPGLLDGKSTYTFYPWGGAAFGYKF